MDVNYTYDGKVNGNMLIVSQTGCGKTAFILNVAKNKIFEKLRYFCCQKLRFHKIDSKIHRVVLI